MNTKHKLPITCFDEKKLQGRYRCGNDNELFCYTRINKKELSQCLDELKKVGYNIDQELFTNDNSFITLTSCNDLIHITYISASKTLKVLYDPLCDSKYISKSSDHKKITDTTLTIIPLDYSHREIADSNGMAFVITLEDGRFIIIDGGYGDYVSNGTQKSSNDAKNLYEYLCKNNKRANDEIEIAAWIITHPHEDHYGAFVKFSELYSHKVSVEYFIYNQGDPSTYSKQYPANSFLIDTLPQIIRSRYNNSKTIKPHVGQSFTFCGTEITVLHTHEACISNFEPTPNDASLVLRINSNKHSILLTADCDETVSTLLVNTFKDYLKSDVLQINHHGYSGMTKDLFDTVSPKYTIWTTSQKAFELRTNGKKYEFIGNAVEVNKYIYDKLNEKCIVADGTLKQIHLKHNSIKISKQ